MLALLWLVPTLPLLGAVLLLSASGRMPKAWTTALGVGSIGLSAALVALIGVQFLSGDQAFYQQVLWTWISAGDLNLGFSLYLDGLSLSMLFVITGVGFLIHIYAAGYMYEDDDYPRFFTYTNLFVAAMIMLVLADNLALMFLGWEGVGLCSFLLIGFWYKKPENGYAARKAFVVTRVGDTAFALGLFLIFKHLHSLDIQQAMSNAQTLWPQGSNTATLIAFLLLGGAVGKSAQLPLQTWLPDAMAGPTPVSALIHAATMVTAGVYLIARTHALFELSHAALQAVALVGVLTLLMAGFTALTQSDLKRVLAYSTISQIGYMFLALGVGAWSSAIFHLMTHAFFKALLFLTAGSIILAVHHQQNIFNMGGLRKALPLPFWAFLIGCLCLTALPPTSGFFSKEAIINAAWSSHTGGPLIWFGAVLGAFLTALYTFRMFFLVFFGPQNTPPDAVTGVKFQLPLIVLAALAMLGGALVLPAAAVLPVSAEHHSPWLIEAIAIATPFVGIFIAFQIFYRRVWSIQAWVDSALGKNVIRFLQSGWAMDWLYDQVFVRPFTRLARLNRHDLVDRLPNALALQSTRLYRALSQSQNGQLRFYVATMATGSILVIALSVFL